VSDTSLSRGYPALGPRVQTVEQVRATIEHLRLLRQRRTAIAEAYASDAIFRRRKDVTGEPRVYLKTDPTWLVDMAINRRAGWLDDPWTFGTTQPVQTRDGLRLPWIIADGNAERHLRQLAGRINTPRLRVYESELGEWRTYLMRRLPNRFAISRED